MAKEEYQERLAAAERKVYALTKERDMLKRDKEKTSGACHRTVIRLLRIGRSD